MAVTLPGFGGRALPDADPDLGRFAEDVASQLPQGEDVILGGCSLGGYVVMEMLRRKLVSPRGLILMDTKHTSDNDQAVANRLVIAERAERGEDLVETLAAPLLGSKSQHLTDSVRGLIEQTPATSIAWTQRAMAARPDSSAVLREFDGKALVIVGEEDALAPVPIAREMAALFTQGQLEVIQDAGHLAPWEMPEVVAKAIARWL